jgi:hypothetical protein
MGLILKKAKMSSGISVIGNLLTVVRILGTLALLTFLEILANMIWSKGPRMNAIEVAFCELVNYLV